MQSSPFARGAEVETLRSHSQPLLRRESAQGHIRSVMVVRPNLFCCKVLHLCQVRPIILCQPVKPKVLNLPFVESGIAKAAAAAQLLDRHACFGLPQEPKICSSVSLLFFMSVILHGYGLHTLYVGKAGRGQVKIASRIRISSSYLPNAEYRSQSSR